ncbi:hypothetical protein EVG20_g6793 [Dentipellis fragilis]|uniref:Uncharacterized protein n=1 Tax=Dentipellis fragilis TaxID=205917 RepID=A0A4Y9YKP4_9AGAM|nr:hypothetical protein EVG20_g6793 [Dentipellis fragilis]
MRIYLPTVAAPKAEVLRISSKSPPAATGGLPWNKIYCRSRLGSSHAQSSNSLEEISPGSVANVNVRPEVCTTSCSTPSDGLKDGLNGPSYTLLFDSVQCGDISKRPFTAHKRTIDPAFRPSSQKRPVFAVEWLACSSRLQRPRPQSRRAPKDVLRLTLLSPVPVWAFTGSDVNTLGSGSISMILTLWQLAKPPMAHCRSVIKQTADPPGAIDWACSKTIHVVVCHQIAKRSRAESEEKYQADKEESPGRPAATVSTNFVQLIETRTLRIEY